MNYTELVEAAKSYADRQDIEVTNSVDLFITMAESRINRVLKTRKQGTRAYIQTVLTKEYYGLPNDYAGMRDIQLLCDQPEVNGKSFPFIQLTPTLFNEMRNAPSSGKLYYSIIANQIQIYPLQDSGNYIEIVYYQKVPNLSQTAVSNWLSEDHPDIYLAGITAEIELFAKNYDVAKGWYDRMSVAIDELDSTDVEERWSGTPLIIRIG